MGYRYWRTSRAIPHLIQRWGKFCARCKKANVNLDVDHIIPRSQSRAGIRDLKNIQFLCRPCHDYKTRRKPTKDYNGS